MANGEFLRRAVTKAQLRFQIMKQSANSAVRFSSYAYLQSIALSYSQPASGKLSSATTFGLGAVAGLITVCESP